MKWSEYLGWASMWEGIEFFAWAALLCGGAQARAIWQADQASRCEAKAIELVFASETCTEAQIRIYGLVRSDPDCRAIFPDGGPDICAEYARRDGGKDGPNGDR